MNYYLRATRELTYAETTVSEWLSPQLEEIRQTGRLPELLPPRMTERALPPYREIER